MVPRQFCAFLICVLPWAAAHAAPGLIRRGATGPVPPPVAAAAPAPPAPLIASNPAPGLAPPNTPLTTDQRIGISTPLTSLPVDVTLLPSGSTPVVGEAWSMLGEITNRSTKTIWIVDSECQLSVPPEIWGVSASESGGALSAFFPTPFRPRDEQGPNLVRIEPGQRFIMSWRVDSFRVPYDVADERMPEGWRQIFDRIGASVRDFLFYRPADFTFNASVHMWSDHPPLFRRVAGGSDLVVANTGESIVLVATTPVLINPSPWVLMLGAVFGGVAAFALQTVYALSQTGGPPLSRRAIAVGCIGAILLPAIGTVLLSRLGASDFLISVKIHDIWGSVASGFILQWLGLRYFSAQIDSFIRRSEANREKQARERQRPKHEPAGGPPRDPSGLHDGPPLGPPPPPPPHMPPGPLAPVA